MLSIKKYTSSTVVINDQYTLHNEYCILMKLKMLHLDLLNIHKNSIQSSRWQMLCHKNAKKGCAKY